MLTTLLLAAQVSTASTATTSAAAEREADLFADVFPEETIDTSSAADDREADLFGGDDRAREAELFGGDRAPREGVIDRIEETLGATQDVLDIGGTLWLWMQYNALEEGSPKTFALTAPSFLDLYLDVRPIDRLRAFVQGRLRYDFTVNDNTINPFTGQPADRLSVALDQYWLKFDILRSVFITAGKQRIRWGASRLWQPTDFLNQQRLDPVALFDLRLGVTLLKVHVPVESLGWNFYAIANLEGASQLRDVGGALRAEFVYGPAELTLSSAFRRNEPERLGMDLSFGVWLFDVRVEGALSHGARAPRVRRTPNLTDGFGTADIEREGFLVSDFLGDDPPVNEFIARFVDDRKDDWIPQLVLGFDITIAYSDQDTITLGAEYFYNDLGVTDASLYPLMFFTGSFTPFYVGRHYASVFVLLPSPGSWDDTTIVLTGIGNLSDRSFFTRAQYSVRFFNYLTVQTFLNYHLGSNGEFHLGLDVPPGDLAAGPGATVPPPLGPLLNGFSITAPLLEVGVALVVDL